MPESKADDPELLKKEEHIKEFFELVLGRELTEPRSIMATTEKELVRNEEGAIVLGAEMKEDAIYIKNTD